MKMKWCLALALCAHTALANVQLFNAETQKALQGLNGSIIGAAASPANAAPANQAVGKYHPNAQVSERVRTDVVARTVGLARANGADEASIQTLANGLQQMDVPAVTWPVLEQMGFDRDNLVTATAYWLLVNWDILHGTQTQGAPAEGVVAQIRAHFADGDKLADVSEADRQYGAEAMLWLALLQFQVYQDAVQAGNTQAIENAKNDAKLAMKQIGFDPDALQLTDQGFAAR